MESPLELESVSSEMTLINPDFVKLNSLLPSPGPLNRLVLPQ